MSKTTLASRLVQTLPFGIQGLFNPWVDPCPGDTDLNGPEARLERLARHLDCDPEFLVIGEASGHLGMRRSAVAFTSERLLLEGSIPRIPPPLGRLTDRRLPYSEPSATIVWKTLKSLRISEKTVLWNALPMHPYKPGNVDSNRTPTAAEIDLGRPALEMLIAAFPDANLVAVGKKAEGLMLAMGHKPTAIVRHPANGGATKFRRGFEDLVYLTDSLPQPSPHR